jgi:hypothetical protein
MKTETDKFKLAVLDGRQLALKVSANRYAVILVAHFCFGPLILQECM